MIEDYKITAADWEPLDFDTEDAEKIVAKKPYLFR